MAPDPGRTYTVGCSFDKLIPDEQHKKAIRDAVLRTHRATILVTELLNLHVRRCVEERNGEGLESIFSSNWLMNAYNEVTIGRPTRIIEELRYTKNMCMPSFEAIDRKGISQIIGYECINLAAVAENNIWMNFHTRVHAYVHNQMRISKEEFSALSNDERRHRKLHLLQIAEDVTRPDSEGFISPSIYHSWITEQRELLGIDHAVGEWNGKPLLYHLKARPHKFIKTMHIMSTRMEANEGRAVTLFPLRRTLVPRHIRFDQKALRNLLGLGSSSYTKEMNAKRQKTNDGSVRKRTRREKNDMREEKAQAFSEVLDMRAAKVRQRHLFNFAFTTDGVCARLQYEKPLKASSNTTLPTRLPTRGIYAIDELKRLSRLDQLHVVGIDPGIREIAVAVDQDNPKEPVVRYTQCQRLTRRMD